MAITRKQRLGSALEGFVQNFWPAYLNLQETQRRTRSDRQRFLESAGSKIFNEYMTPAQLETFIDAAVERGDFKTRDEARTALTPYMPTDEQRWAKGWSELGDDPATWTPTRAQQIMRSFGIEDPFQETFLPSRPISGVVGLAGAPPLDRRLPSQPISGVTGLGQEPAVDATGKILEPLDRGPLQQPPPGIEIGELQEPGWGGPQAEMFDKIKAEALAEEAATEQRQLGYADTALRQQLNITEEMEEEFWDTETDRMVRRVQDLGKEETTAYMDRYRKQLTAQRDDELSRMEEGGKFSQAYEDQQRRLAIISAIVNDRPEWFNRMDPETGAPRTFSVTRDWRTGSLRFSEVTGSFDDTAPWYGSVGRSETTDPIHILTLGSLMSSLTEEGLDINTNEGRQFIMENATLLDIPPETTINYIKNMQYMHNAPPGLVGNNLPPPPEGGPPGPTDDIDEFIERFYDTNRQGF